MSIVFLFLGCFILYGKSKFFPEHLSKIGSVIKRKKQIATIIAYSFLLSSYAVLASQFGWGTGFAIFIMVISFVYSLLLVVLPIHKNYMYTIALLSIFIIIIESIL